MRFRRASVACILCFVFIGSAVPVHHSYAQSNEVEVFNDHRPQPEAWHFPGPQEPGVGSGGDLSLSIPLMTVPGRGLNYDITLSYTSGITADQNASWVGLGWSLGLPVISRDIEGGAWRKLTTPEVGYYIYGVDAWDNSNLPAGQPDPFYVTLPGGGTTEFTQSNKGFPFVTVPGRASTGGDFIPNDHIPWKIEASDPVNLTWSSNDVQDCEVDTLKTGQATEGGGAFEMKPDIARFEVTTADGSRYVFAEPTLSYYDKRADVNHGGADFALYTRQMYVDTWRLVAMLGPDFVGDPQPDLNGWPEDGTQGSWVRFVYSDDIEACDNDVVPTFADPAVRVSQRRYLQEIITPTHRAEFTTENILAPAHIRNGELYSPDLYVKLTNIKLYNRIGATQPSEERLVGEVILDQSNEKDEGGLGPAGSDDWDIGRLALKNVSFFDGAGVERPGYTFLYADNPLGHYTSYCKDHFGYLDSYGSGCSNYSGEEGGAAWSLTTIEYPTGGRDVITYETDVVAAENDVPYFLAEYEQDHNDPVGMTGQYYPVRDGDTPSKTRQGGARVTQIARYEDVMDGGSAPLITTYDYGTGLLSGVPPGYWREELARKSDFTDFKTLFQPSSRGKVSVVYTHVEKILPDGSSTKTFYTTSDYVPPGMSASPFKPGEMLEMSRVICWDACAYNMVLVQGRSPWAWGIPYRTEVWAYDEQGQKVLVGDTETTYAPSTPDPVSPPVTPFGDALAYAYQAIGDAFVVPILYGSLQKMQEVNHTHEDNLTMSITTTYEYDEKTGFVVATTASDGIHTRRTEQTYAYQRFEPVYVNMKADNILRPVVEQKVSDGTTYHGASITTWGTFNGFFKPTATYNWLAEAPSTSLPSFTWSNPPSSTDAPVPGWQASGWFTEYNAHGNLTKQKDARGITTTLYYGDNSNPLSNQGGLENAYLTGAESESFAIQIAYDETLMQPTSVIDESGATTRYTYDGFGRLTSVTNTEDQLLATYCYHYAGAVDSCDTSAPNAVVTTSYLDFGKQLVTRGYFDGLGRAIQTQLEYEGLSTVTASEYDITTGRPVRTYKPYERDDIASQFDPLYVPHANEQYNGQDGYPDADDEPYAETIYWADPRGLVKEVHAPGGIGVATQKTGVEDINGTKYAYAETVDEDGNASRSYTDVWGNQVQTRQFYDGEWLDTAFEYDAVGNLLATYPPNAVTLPGGSAPADWATFYTYNTLGQLAQKATPDTDNDFFYAYDVAGRLRYAKKPDGKVLFSEYDDVNRIKRTGACAIAFPTDVVDDTPCASASEEVSYVYDDYSTSMLPDGVVDANTQSRLTEVHFEGGYYQYFYDSLGRVIAFYNVTDNLDGKLTTYEYNLSGSVTKVSYQPAVQEESLFFWYTYDAAGRLSRVTSNTEDDEGSAVSEAHYVTYTPSGQVRQLQLGDPSVIPAIDYTYHIRDWLTQINDPSDLGNDIFAMRLGYETNVTGGSPTYLNGNISSVEWHRKHAGDDAFQYGPSNIDDVTNHLGYSFEYDVLSRLTSADFKYNNGAWQNTGDAGGAYDVGSGTGIQYDANGNILQLQRKGRDKFDNPVVSTDLVYTYAPGSNRLECVDEPTLGLSCNDPFVYDANGNMIKSRVADAITHDRRNLPTTMVLPDGTQQAFRYDADGQRIYKKLIDAEGNTIEETYYVRGVGGTVMAVYETKYEEGVAQGPHLKYWNILSGGTVIGRIDAGTGSGTGGGGGGSTGP